MIINHNMSAINANRQMATNQANTARSTEKLSSGLRINRAGDDAAGLAISEKMRAQVAGLNQATRNAQDGISMIQTAEGALNESHSILQRMRELSVQSSNDTNTDNDRTEIQKEISQLTEEVDRIGNTTEFNTKKLLQGNKQATDVGATVTAGAEAKDAVTAKAAEWTISSADLTAAKTALSADGNKGSVEFMGVKVNIAVATGVTSLEITDASKDSINLKLKVGASEKELTEALEKALNEAKKVSGSPLENMSIKMEATGASYEMKITGTEADGEDNNSKKITTVGFGTAEIGTSVEGVTGKAAVNQTFDVSLDKLPTEGSSIKIGNKTVSFYDSSKTTFTDETDAKDKLDSTYAIDINGKSVEEIAAKIGKLDFSEKDNSGATVSVVGNKLTFTAQKAGEAGTDLKVETSDIYTGKKSELTTVAIGRGDLSTLSEDVDMKVQFGSKAFEVDLSSIAKDLDKIGTYGHSQQKELLDVLRNAKATDGSKLSDVADLEIGTDGKIKITAKEESSDNFEITLTGTDTERGEVNKAFGLKAEGSTVGVAGKNPLEAVQKDFTASFQVGANQGQSMDVTISDMRAEALGIAKIDVSKKDGAEKAIATIDDAITKVSAQRSNLGAVQNRLEHTINNLGTSSENLTSAESRVRDVDMAEEMMEFTKNNVLSQASQAMLAQAKALPNQVLSLLQ